MHDFDDIDLCSHRRRKSDGVKHTFALSGFLGGGFFGSGASETTTNTAVNTTNTQVTTGGPTVFGNGDISTTDLGAIDRAADISQSALDLGADAISGGNSVAVAGLDNARHQLESSLQFGQGIAGDAFSFVQNILGHEADVVNKSIAGNAALASQVSQSSQQTINESLVKLATIAALAIAAVFIFRGSRA